MEDYYSKGSCFAEWVEEQINTVDPPAEAVCCLLYAQTTQNHGLKIFSVFGNNSNISYSF